MIKLRVSTAQEAFDTAIEKITAQGVPSYDRSLSCCVYNGSKLYQKKPNVSCAIGHLVAKKHRSTLDDHVSSAICNPVTGIRELISSNVIDPGNIDPGVLEELQSCHDNAGSNYPAEKNSREFLNQFYSYLYDTARSFPDTINTAKLDAAKKKLDSEK